MIVALFASLLLASTAQDPTASPDVAAPAQTTEMQPADVYTEEPSNGDPVDGNQDPYQPVEEPAQPVEPVQPEPAPAVEEPEEEVDMVCRRTTVYNEFGRQRSRRVCRPRDEW